jgi:hypothetical protein
MQKDGSRSLMPRKRKAPKERPNGASAAENIAAASVKSSPRPFLSVELSGTEIIVRKVDFYAVYYKQRPPATCASVAGRK